MIVIYEIETTLKNRTARLQNDQRHQTLHLEHWEEMSVHVLEKKIHSRDFNKFIKLEKKNIMRFTWQRGKPGPPDKGGSGFTGDPDANTQFTGPGPKLR